MKTICRAARTMARDQRGQSLIETALAIPILLLIVVGVVDVARVFVAKTETTNAAREAAALAARDPQATIEQICQRARDELGAGSGGCVSASLEVTCTRGGATCGSETDLSYSDPTPPLFTTAGEGGADVTVSVTYGIDLVSGQLLGRAFAVNPVAIRSAVWFPGLSR
ncbi:MAG TPA: TadE/TadG family type IV pilus assembly protein [Candidatus Acidoferrales bacterium]|nr:TadE/TadG family type IV pilus assembly protein [Candidatus Acidoferrales bacterium]